MCNGEPGFVSVDLSPHPDTERGELTRAQEDERFSLRGTCAEATVAAIIRDVIGNPFRAAPLALCGGKLAVLTKLTIEEAKSQSHGNLWARGKLEAVYDTMPPQLWLNWAGGTVGLLVQEIYEERLLPDGAFDATRVAALADTLEKAGCTHPGILGHLRSPGIHVRGCWLVDLLLGKC
jgi:hypothetical protein